MKPKDWNLRGQCTNPFVWTYFFVLFPETIGWLWFLNGFKTCLGLLTVFADHLRKIKKEYKILKKHEIEYIKTN